MKDCQLLLDGIQIPKVRKPTHGTLTTADGAILTEILPTRSTVYDRPP